MKNRDPCIPGMVVRLKAGEAPMIIVRQISMALVEVLRIPARICPPPYDSAATERRATDKLVQLRSIEDVAAPYRYRLQQQHLAAIRPRLPELISQHFSYTEETTDMIKLYQTKEDPPRFGTLLATNSAGLSVLEMKGTGEVLTFRPDAIEVVHPYTVDVVFLDGGNGPYSFLSQKGDVKVGDLLVLDGYESVARVKRVDTKSPKATKHLKGVKLVTTPIGDPDVVDPADG